MLFARFLPDFAIDTCDQDRMYFIVYTGKLLCLRSEILLREHEMSCALEKNGNDGN